MGHPLMRVPRLHRLQYLDALLNSYNGQKFDEVRARQAIQHEIQDFERKKALALRRQRPRISEGASTLEECLSLAFNLGLIDQDKRLKSDASLVRDPASRRHFLISSFWHIYPRFRQVVLTVRDAGPLDLPFYDWDDFRKQGGDLYGLDMDRRNFETIRDFATQLELINWYPTEASRQVVYSAACVATYAELIWMAAELPVQETCHQCRQTIALETGILTIQENRYRIQEGSETIPSEYLVLQTNTEQVFIKNHQVNLTEFEQTLWREYLELAEMVPMSPVLYPSLRNRVCSALHISDPTFDNNLAKLIKQPQRLNIFPSDGTLNYAANLAHIGKLLPPQSSEGNFIVYLKMERRNK